MLIKMSASQIFANIRILHSHSGQTIQTWVVPVIPETTLGEILKHVGMDPELFNASAADPYVFVNEGDTAMLFLDRNMLDYNNWYIDHGFIPSLFIKRRSQIANDHGW